MFRWRSVPGLRKSSARSIRTWLIAVSRGESCSVVPASPHHFIPVCATCSCIYGDSLILNRSQSPFAMDAGRNMSTNVPSQAENADSLSRRVIKSPKAPAAIGPYSHAIQANNMLFISGQLGLDAATGELVPGGVEKEAEQALVNMGSILHAAQADYKNVVKTTVLLADMKDFQAVNQVYAKFFTQDPPARAAYQVAALPKNGRVEIEAIAYLG